MVEVLLPREIKANELLDLLEEAAKELGHKTERNPWDYVIAPGSIKREPRKEDLIIDVYPEQPKQYSNNLWGRLMKRLFYSPDFNCKVSVALDTQYKIVDVGVRWRAYIHQYIGMESTGWKGAAWKKIEARFDQLIDKLYDKLGYSPQTQGNVNPT